MLGNSTVSLFLWGTERSGVSVTTLHCLVGGRVVFNTRAYFVSFAILVQRRLCAFSLKELYIEPMSVVMQSFAVLVRSSANGGVLVGTAQWRPVDRR